MDYAAHFSVKLRSFKKSRDGGFTFCTARLNFPVTLAVVGFTDGWLNCGECRLHCTFWVILRTFEWGFIAHLRGHGNGEKKRAIKYISVFALCRKIAFFCRSIGFPEKLCVRAKKH